MTLQTSTKWSAMSANDSPEGRKFPQRSALIAQRGQLAQFLLEPHALARGARSDQQPFADVVVKRPIAELAVALAFPDGLQRTAEFLVARAPALHQLAREPVEFERRIR